MVSLGSSDTSLEFITVRDASKARSSAGAKSTLNPSARQLTPITRPCWRNNFRSPEANTSAAGRCRPQYIAQPVDLAAFKIDAPKQRSRYVLLAIPKKLVGLVGADDVAREENHAALAECARAGKRVQETLRCRRTDDKQLADAFADGVARGPGFLAGVSCDRGPLLVSVKFAISVPPAGSKLQAASSDSSQPHEASRARAGKSA